jgi:hypothetical protein
MQSSVTALLSMGAAPSNAASNDAANAESDLSAENPFAHIGLRPPQERR